MCLFWGLLVVKRFVCVVLLALLVVVPASTFRVEVAEADYVWTETITIHANGTVTPSGAPILRVGDIYTFTDDIVNASLSGGTIALKIERDNTVIDGAGYMLSGTGSGTGIYLLGRTNVTIKNTRITKFVCGIYLGSSVNNGIFGNNITSNNCGINLRYSSNNNNIFENNITRNGYGIASSYSSSNNSVYHNNFLNNAQQVLCQYDSINVWDDGYPSGGNCWSGYAGADLNHDGIGETQYSIDADNVDRYPLMGMFRSFNTALGEAVNTVSNSTIENFHYFIENSTITIHASNMTINQTFGSVRICIPTM